SLLTMRADVAAATPETDTVVVAAQTTAPGAENTGAASTTAGPAASGEGAENAGADNAAAQKRNDAGEQIARAFPTDMEHKPLTAYSVQYGTVNVYKDSSLSEQIGQVDGARLWIVA